jgi:ribulose bisphosphate carboxylase small subunit
MVERLVPRHDEALPEVDSHPFEPRKQWWSLCKHCGLAQAAHSSSTIDTRMAMLQEHMDTYGEVRHIDPVKKAELEEEVERERNRPDGRVRVGYVSDDFPDDE